MATSPPKRKRGEHRASSPTGSPTSRSPPKLMTNFPQDTIHPLSAHNSPRTKVAWRFQGLELSSPVSKLDLTKQQPILSTESPLSPSDEIRKRVKILEANHELEPEIPETPAQVPMFKIDIGPERAVDPFIQEKAAAITLQNSIDPVIFSAQKNMTLKNTRNISTKKRAGTPPLKFNSKTPIAKDTTFLDMDQASLTWHDDEITGYQDDDPEDDGEGINGIGFKPTPLQAYQRMEKRRQQMADYKMRETREARAKRGARRRGSVSEVAAAKVDGVNGRRVRFMEDGNVEAGKGEGARL